MKKEIELTLSVEDLAEQLYNLDNEQVANLFSIWKRKFDEGYEERKAAGQPIWIFDLNHFMMYVVPKLDEDGLDFFRSAYSTMIYQMCDNVSKKHLLKLNLSA